MYSRAERKDLTRMDFPISIPENYSGATFRGGLAEGLSLPNDISDEPKIDQSDHLLTIAQVPPHMAMIPSDTIGSDKDIDQEECPSSQAEECVCHTDKCPKKDETIRECERARETEKGLFGLDSEELLILGVALLAWRGRLEGDVLMLILLLLL